MPINAIPAWRPSLLWRDSRRRGLRREARDHRSEYGYSASGPWRVEEPIGVPSAAWFELPSDFLPSPDSTNLLCMAKSSTVPDSIDPAPRLLRIVATALGADPWCSETSRRLRRAAEVLEGAPMDDRESNLALGRLLGRERRVEVRERTAPEKPTKRHANGLPVLNAEDERHRQRLIERGVYPGLRGSGVGEEE